MMGWGPLGARRRVVGLAVRAETMDPWDPWGWAEMAVRALSSSSGLGPAMPMDGSYRIYVCTCSLMHVCLRFYRFFVSP